MSLKLKAAPPPESDEDSAGDEEEIVNKRLKLLQEFDEFEKPNSDRFTGGIVVSLESELNDHSTNASLSAAEKKGLKEVEELKRELDLQNTFSKETNRRDEDAEMNKYIDEQIKLRREAAKKERQSRSSDQGESQLDGLFTSPSAIGVVAAENLDDILLHTLSKNYSSTIDEKSEAMLSSQMLNGIPEVDLGMNERIRTIEATEEAKLRLVSSGSSNNTNRHHQHSTRKPSSTAPVNFSCNFQQHRSSRDQNEGELKTSRTQSKTSTSYHNSEPKTKVEPVVSVGEEPKEVELRLPSVPGERKPPLKGRASDDYYLQKYKKNNRR